MATVGRPPEQFQSSVHAAQFVAVPAADARIAGATAAVVPLRIARTGFYQRRGKRIGDLVLGALLLIGLMPLIVCVAVAVLLTSGWPILYGSKRIGLDGLTFPMWKFRTMVHDADAVFERWKETHPDRAQSLLTHWKLEEDPRVTALGRFLRKSSLDELPQFWNVLCGEMSIVGPRPYLSRESLDPALMPAIIAVRPGLTGPFQVCGRKGLAPQARMQLEAGYAPDVRPMRDIGYMLRTVKPLVKLDGE